MRIIVNYKPHGTKVSIRPKEFDARVHERIVQGKPTPSKIELKDEKESNPNDISQEELEDLWEAYRVKTGKLPIGRWRNDVKWLKEKTNEN